MPASLLDTLGTQMRFVLQFEARDAPKRIAAAMAVSAVMTYFGLGRQAALSLALIMSTEVLVRLQILRLPSPDWIFDRRSVRAPLSALVINACTYCLPAIFLIQSDRHAAHLAAFLWLGGFLVHAAGVHALIKVWSWLAIVPPSAATVLCVILYNGALHTDTHPWDSAVLLVSTILAVGNTIEVVMRQRDNRDAFAEAQIAANERLKKLVYLSEHDPLTGLLNRHAFDARLQDALDGATPARPVAVMLIDLDKFKPINDTHGHAAGDRVLQAVAERLRGVAGEAFTARLGGDEFAVMVADASDASAVGALAGHVRDTLGLSLDHDWAEIAVSASVGLAFGHGGTDTVESLCARADRAMYRAKDDAAESPVIEPPPWLGKAAG